MLTSEVVDIIMKRRSSVNFSKKPVEGKMLGTLFEAARWAPSAFNGQPWRFIYAHKQDTFSYNCLFELLYEGNQLWAGNAPVLVLSMAERISQSNPKENIYAWHDTGLATTNLFIQAVAMGLQVHPMGGFDRGKARSKLHIPPAFDPVAMIAVGYPGDMESLSDELKKRENSSRSRKPLGELVFYGEWGRTLEVSG